MKMTLNCLRILKFCHYVIYYITFIGLFVLCYFLYIKEAVEKSSGRATTVIKLSENIPYEAPSILICPEPSYKRFIIEKYNLTKSTRMGFPFENYLKNTFQKQAVQEFFE